MDRLDYDLRDYYAQIEETCPNCGECILEEYDSCNCEEEEE